MTKLFVQSLILKKFENLYIYVLIVKIYSTYGSNEEIKNI